MHLVAGVDGAKAKWLLVSRDGNARITSEVASTPADLCQSLVKAAVIAVDVPIGLTDYGQRQCDREARKELRRPRASSVFSPPIRPVLNAENRETASIAHEKIDGRRIGAQAWGIFPKIRDWDTYLRENSDVAKRVFEVHPEVCFWALNDFRPMLHAKRLPEGQQERRNLLADAFGTEALDQARSRHSRREVADDDLYDAFVALWSAERIRAGTARCFPASSQRDSAGLPMTIWY